jgi:3',5'-cyclic AMP phosphodiesterase CpdA
MCELPDNLVKIIVTHHPFDLPAGFEAKNLVGRAKLAMKTLAGCGADVFLAGHLHVSHISHSAERYKIAGHSALVIQAGTATSTRGRGESNSFNILRLAHPRLIVERLEWQISEERFGVAETQEFNQTAEGWMKVLVE